MALVDGEEFNTVQELFKKRNRWTWGTYAKNKNGFPVSSSSPHATCFCLTGGLFRIYGKDRFPELRKTIDASIRELFPNCVGSSIPEFNDSHSFKEVQRVVKHAGV